MPFAVQPPSITMSEPVIYEEEFDEFLTDVYYECIHHVYSRLSLLGHDVEEQFDGYD